MRYSRSSRSGQRARLKGMEPSNPLMPRMFNGGSFGNGWECEIRRGGAAKTVRRPRVGFRCDGALRARHMTGMGRPGEKTARFLHRVRATVAGFPRQSGEVA